MEQIALVAAAAAAVVMFSLGLDLTPADFARVVRRPRALAVGLVNQFVLLPGVTYLACRLWPVEPALFVGFMVIAACPGSAPSNLMTQFAGGDRALSVSLTGITSAMSFLTIPAAIALAAAASRPDRDVGMPILANAARILAVCGLPLVAGMVVRRLRPAAAKSLAQLFPPFCLLAVVVVLAVTLWVERQQVAAALAGVGARALALNVSTLGLSYALARLAGVDRASVIALCLECSLHNALLGVYVCVTLLRDPVAVLPGLAYGLIMWGTATAFVLAVRRRRTTPAPGGSPRPSVAPAA